MRTTSLYLALIGSMLLGVSGFVRADDAAGDQAAPAETPTVVTQDDETSGKPTMPPQISIDTRRSKGMYDLAPGTLAALDEYPELQKTLRAISPNYDKIGGGWRYGRAEQLQAYDIAFRCTFGKTPRYTKEDMDTLMLVYHKSMRSKKLCEPPARTNYASMPGTLSVTYVDTPRYAASSYSYAPAAHRYAAPAPARSQVYTCSSCSR